MKQLSILILVALTAFSASAQSYRGQAPKFAEQRKTAGLNFYPVEANMANWRLVAVAAGSSTNILVGQNQNIILMSNDVCTASVVLPNPTNNIGVVCNILTTFRTQAILTNGGIGFNIASTTNTTSGAGWLARTNQLITCINPGGTNWLAIVLSP